MSSTERGWFTPFGSTWCGVEEAQQSRVERAERASPCVRPRIDCTMCNGAIAPSRFDADGRFQVRSHQIAEPEGDAVPFRVDNSMREGDTVPLFVDESMRETLDCHFSSTHRYVDARVGLL